MTQVGINGFGRSGRATMRALQARHPELEVVAINDLASPDVLSHLFKYDSTYGPYPGEVFATNDGINIDGRSIRIFSERSPEQIPWDEAGAEIVLEVTGRFTDAEKARGHLQHGVRKVIICAPATNEDLTIVLGVNEHMYDPDRHNVISNASCTTNGLAPVAKVLHERFRIKTGLLTTVHAYTNTQSLLDSVATDVREARAAPQNIVPSPTGAAKAIGKVIPELQGRFTGMAFRVPTATVSVIDFTAHLEVEASANEVNEALKEAAEGELKGILAYSELALVSMDFRGDQHSSIVSGVDTISLGGLVKVVAWYDNEMGYSSRVSDLAAYVGEKLPVASRS